MPRQTLRRETVFDYMTQLRDEVEITLRMVQEVPRELTMQEYTNCMQLLGCLSQNLTTLQQIASQALGVPSA